jgi:hypothetical protein
MVGESPRYLVPLLVACAQCICEEIAQNFKDQGNDYFKGKRYREALNFYTQGVGAKPTDLVIQEALLCNRAACNLELSTHVLQFCSDIMY